MQVNIATARAHLSELIKAANAGEKVILLRRNQPVAEINPILSDSPLPMPDMALVRKKVGGDNNISAVEILRNDIREFC